MSLSNNLREYVAACFTGLWIESHEHQDALSEIAQLCSQEQWRLAVWDIAQGLQLPGQHGESDSATTDPLAAISAINALASPDSSALLVLQNFHKFLGSPEIIQTLAQQIIQGKQNRTFVVVLSPLVSIPVELEKHFVVIEHQLPDREQLEEIARGIATEEGELPEGDELNHVLDAAAGLTRFEAEGAFSLSLVRHSRVEPSAIWELKSQMLKKSGLVSLHHGSEAFDTLGGLDSLKHFCTRAMRQQGQENPLQRPRGVMLLSPPGCGKSQFAKSLGNETGRPTLILDVGSLMGSLVGQTESNIRQALSIADAMAPCVLFADEVEKALAGVASSGQTDSGVSARLVRHLSDLAQRPRQRRIRGRHLQRHFQVAAGVFACRAVRRRVLPGPARLGAEGSDLGHLVAGFELDADQPKPPDRPVDWRRDPGLLPAGGAAGCAAGRSRPERGAGRRHRQRVGGATA